MIDSHIIISLLRDVDANAHECECIHTYIHTYIYIDI